MGYAHPSPKTGGIWLKSQPNSAEKSTEAAVTMFHPPGTGDQDCVKEQDVIIPNSQNTTLADLYRSTDREVCPSTTPRGRSGVNVTPDQFCIGSSDTVLAPLGLQPRFPDELTRDTGEGTNVPSFPVFPADGDSCADEPDLSGELGRNATILQAYPTAKTSRGKPAALGLPPMATRDLMDIGLHGRPTTVSHGPLSAGQPRIQEDFLPSDGSISHKSAQQIGFLEGNTPNIKASRLAGKGPGG